VIIGPILSLTFAKHASLIESRAPNSLQATMHSLIGGRYVDVMRIPVLHVSRIVASTQTSSFDGFDTLLNGAFGRHEYSFRFRGFRIAISLPPIVVPGTPALGLRVPGTVFLFTDPVVDSHDDSVSVFGYKTGLGNGPSSGCQSATIALLTKHANNWRVEFFIDSARGHEPVPFALVGVALIAPVSERRRLRLGDRYVNHHTHSETMTLPIGIRITCLGSGQ